jgi:hypothetical protein
LSAILESTVGAGVGLGDGSDVGPGSDDGSGVAVGSGSDEALGLGVGELVPSPFRPEGVDSQPATHRIAMMIARVVFMSLELQ